MCVCVCVSVSVYVVCCVRVENTENHKKQREMRVVWCVLCGVMR